MYGIKKSESSKDLQGEVVDVLLHALRGHHRRTACVLDSVNDCPQKSVFTRDWHLWITQGLYGHFQFHDTISKVDILRQCLACFVYVLLALLHLLPQSGVPALEGLPVIDAGLQKIILLFFIFLISPALSFCKGDSFSLFLLLMYSNKSMYDS